MITPIKAETVEIEISDGQVQPTPIAVAPFTGDSKYAQEITQIIVSDLESSGLFHSVNPRGFNQTTESILTEGPRFSDWKMLGADPMEVIYYLVWKRVIDSVFIQRISPRVR